MKKQRLKTNNQFGIDYDFPGLCALCHTEIAEFDGSFEARPGVFRPKILELKPNYRAFQFKLNDGSFMNVTSCEDCHDEFKPEDSQELMESVINGWQEEIDSILIEWEDEKKRNHMKEYSKKHIVDRSDKRLKYSDLSKLKKPRPEKLKVKV